MNKTKNYILQGLYQIYCLLLLLMLDCSTTGANGNPCRLPAVVSCCVRHVSLLQTYLTYIYHTSLVSKLVGPFRWMLSLKPVRLRKFLNEEHEAHIYINWKNKNTLKSDKKNIYAFQICEIPNLDILLCRSYGTLFVCNFNIVILCERIVAGWSLDTVNSCI
jgi:hypothetical protein